MDDKWETKRSVCIRFNGDKSPNVLTGEALYPHGPPKMRQSAKLFSPNLALASSRLNCVPLPGTARKRAKVETGSVKMLDHLSGDFTAIEGIESFVYLFQFYFAALQ